MEIYIVKCHDTVESIAEEYGITTESIIFNNQIPSPYPLTTGQALLLSTKSGTETRPDLFSNGYAYPSISNYVLWQSFPFLAGLSVISYSFTHNGHLVPPGYGESRMIAAAKQNDTMPLLTLTTEQNNASNNFLSSAVLNNPRIQSVLIDELMQVMSEKKYSGINIDFHDIEAEDKLLFADFVWNVRQSLNPLGYLVSVALPPKLSDYQSGASVRGYDFGLLGEAADHLVLMAYEFGCSASGPMAIAPINRVRSAVEYAVSRIPAEKIRLGIPNYGFDWSLPHISGISQARVIGNIDAAHLAITHQSEIHFDETSMSPFFFYTEFDTEHIVWFEDVRSLNAKFDLVCNHELNGVGYWQIDPLFRASFLLLDDRFIIQSNNL